VIKTQEKNRWQGFIGSCIPGQLGAKHALSLELLAGDGSTRRFYRIDSSGFRAVLMVNPHPPSASGGTVDENDSFVYLAGLLRQINAGAPQVFGFDREAGLVLMEDLGDECFQERVLAEGIGSHWTEKAYRRLLDLLLAVQFEGGAVFDPERVFNTEYDADFMFEAESCYFEEYFVEKLCGEQVRGLRDELRRLADRAAESFGINVLLYRDFQSRNIMLGPGEKFRLLDFQGARLGPPAYDPASLINDSYVALPHELRHRLVGYYSRRLAERSPEAAGVFDTQFPLVAAHRLMQALGAYAKLSLVEGKRYFMKYVPSALNDLRSLVSGGMFDDFTILRKALRQLEKKLIK
jgi:N-acetylmuramate 1-kinase